MRDGLVKWLTRLLFGFVLVSIGFALGREAAVRRLGPSPAGAPSAAAPRADRVLVQYLHTTFRCPTCNAMEQATRALLDSAFAADLAAGRVEWRAADFQKDEALAKRYDVASTCVVVAKIRDGRQKAFQRLDDIWTRYQDPAAFDQYVGGAIRGYLAEIGKAE